MLNKNLILEQKQDEIDKGLESLTYKIIVLDDDPTGTQTVKDLPVYTDWSLEYIKDGFQQANQMFYILTNSRALNQEETTIVHKEIMTNIEQISKELNQPFIVISRGDSTLRGHFYLEPKVLNDSASHGFDGVFYIPAFFEGQRYTYNGIHYLQEDDAYIPVANSEFAQDTTFGFSAERMDDFIAEKSNGDIKSDDVYHITLQQLRNRESETIMSLFDDLQHFDAVVVDALNDEDLDFFVACLTSYLSTHKKQFMFRTAASFVKAICETPGEIINLNDVSDNSHGGIIIVGSHVKKSSDQLNHLIAHSDIQTIEFDVTEVTKPSLTDYIKSIIAQVERLIAQGEDVVVYTPR
ncbi:four-carbon acid sugar kinase family protein, partial [Staphylococcus arlettae]|uniref:four-carbon acid sugar kinase family protein n=1 Tax=Staphylococcus arlettae TaxID=29378 RepID=UPI000E697FDA